MPRSRKAVRLARQAVFISDTDLALEIAREAIRTVRTDVRWGGERSRATETFAERDAQHAPADLLDDRVAAFFMHMVAALRRQACPDWLHELACHSWCNPIRRTHSFSELQVAWTSSGEADREALRAETGIDGPLGVALINRFAGWISDQEAVQALQIRHPQPMAPRPAAQVLGLSGHSALEADPSELVEDADFIAYVKKAITYLDDTSAYVVNRRFGLDGRCPATLKTLSWELESSRDTVSKIEGDAIRDLQIQLGRHPDSP